MEFLDLSLPNAETVVINFPGRPMTHQIEPVSHLGFHDKYRVVGGKIQSLGISFIGCQQTYHNAEIVPHIERCLTILTKEIKSKIVILMGSSAGAGGILASALSRKIAQGIILLNTNPHNVGKEISENGLRDISGWVDFYNGFEDVPGNARWAERVAHETQAERITHNRIHGTHGLTAEQVLEGVLKSLRERGYIQ